MKTIETYLKGLLLNKGWKAPATAGVIALIVLALLQSVLFALIVELIKLALALGAIALFVYAIYLAMPEIKKKFEEAKRKP